MTKRYLDYSEESAKESVGDSDILGMETTVRAINWTCSRVE